MTGLGRAAGTKRRRGFKTAPRRAEWGHGAADPCLIRGTNRQVIVVRSPDPEVFEEAIFVIRGDRMKNAGAQQVLEEARRAAEAYLVRSGARFRRRRRARLWAALSAAAVVLAAGGMWAAARLLGY